MRKLYFFLSFIAMFAAGSLLISCTDDDNICPEEEASHDEIYHPDLDGIWLTTSMGVVGDYENPVDIEYAGFFIGEPGNTVSFLFVNNDKIFGEFRLFADADSLVVIESDLFQEIEAQLKNKGKEIDYMNLPVPAGNEQLYAKMHYELVNKDSLVFMWNDMVGTQFTGFTRLTEVENMVQENTPTRGDNNIIEKKVIPTVNYIQAKIDEKKIPTEPDDSQAIYLSMDELNAMRTGSWSYEQWMTGLPGDIKINEISIPGAHDACTAGVGFFAKTMNANCQILTLSEQLQAGVRCFDIRTRINSSDDSEKDLGTYHGQFSCDLPFEDVMSTMKEFLDKNKGEFVILNVSYESKNVGTDYRDKSIELYHKVENQYKEMIRPYYPGQPLDSVRGKILIINHQNVGDNNLKIGAYIGKDGDNNANKKAILYKYRNALDKDGKKVIVSDTVTMWVQNFYEIGFFSNRDRIEKKKKAIYDFAYSALDEPEIPVFITQMNANTGNILDLDCRTYAEMFNSYAFKMLWDNMYNTDYPPLKGGIYSMDYAGGRSYTSPGTIDPMQKKIYVYGDRLVWAVIELNYRNYYKES